MFIQNYVRSRKVRLNNYQFYEFSWSMLHSPTRFSSAVPNKRAPCTIAAGVGASHNGHNRAVPSKHSTCKPIVEDEHHDSCQHVLISFPAIPRHPPCSFFLIFLNHN